MFISCQRHDCFFCIKVKGMSPVTVRDSVRSLRSQDGGPGGWNIPDDTEVSIATQWTDGKVQQK